MLRNAWLISVKLNPQFTVAPVLLVKTFSTDRSLQKKLLKQVGDKNLPPSNCNQPQFMPHIGNQMLCQKNIPKEQHFKGIRFLHSLPRERN